MTVVHTTLAMVVRDVVVLRKQLRVVILRTLVQPFLLVFVFTYVFPQIGTVSADAGAAFSTTLVAGVLGITIMSQGIQAVALPLVHEFGTTGEIEDRVLAPVPVSVVAVAKVVSGAAQGLVAALVVFPIAAVVPATPVDLGIEWWVLLTLTPLAAVACASLGLYFGTRFEPRAITVMFSIVVLPLTFLGCTYYSWAALEPIELGGVPWLQWLVLVNPLVYVNEGLRAAVTGAEHLPLRVVYPALVALTALCLWRGIAGFRRRVLS